MENQNMQDAPPISHPSGFSSQSSKEVSHHNQVLDTTSNSSDKAVALAAPASSGATTAPAAGSPTQLSREQILDATLQCLCEKGYDATTIRQIASRLGCAIGSIYRYYRDKHDLLSCVTQRPFEAVAHAAEANESFPAVARMYSKLAAAEAQSYVLMFWLANQKRKDAEQAQTAFELPDVIRRIISAWSMQMGTRQAALSRWSVLHGAVTAGADALAMLTAMDLMTTGHASAIASNSGDDSLMNGQAHDLDDEPHDRTAQQIVTVMRNPPMPRSKAHATASTQAAATRASIASASTSQQVNAAPDTDNTDDQHASDAITRQKEDVCLL